MTITMETVFVGIVRCCVHESGEDEQAIACGIVSGAEPAEAEWRDIEDDLDWEAHSPMQRFVVEVELPFRPTFKDIDVVRSKRVLLKPSLRGDV